MPNIEEIISEKKFVTDRISTQVRIISVGLLATTWSLLIGQVNIFINTLQCFRIHFILISIFAIITLVLDFLQYKFSYLNIDKTINKMRNEKIDKADYDDKDICYKLSTFCFKNKQLTLLVGVVYFIITMFIIILTS